MRSVRNAAWSNMNMSSIVIRSILAVVLPLLGVALWYYPLMVSVAKPTLARVGITQVMNSFNPQAQVNNSFSYPSLGIQAPLKVSANTSPLKATDWETIRVALRSGVSVAYEAASFEHAPLVFVTGHSSDTYPHTYASVFAGLNRATNGDDVSLVIDDKKYSYKVIEKKVVNPNDLDSFRSLEPTDTTKQRIALVTCWPVLTTKNRMVVVAERTL